MKTLQLSLGTLLGIFLILFASSYVGFATAESTSILDSSIPPIILTQVELWGPSSFHTDGIIQCEDNETSLGPWAVGWVELHNTQNDSITITDVDLKGKGWEEGQFPMTIGPQEYCYIVTQNQLSTRIGVGGSLGNGPPPHDNASTTLSYSVKSFDKKLNYTDSTPPLSDDIGDTKTWQLVDSNWIFQNTDFKKELSTKITMLPPLKQFRSGIATNDITCRQGLQLIFKIEGNFPACVKITAAFHLSDLGWGYLPSPFIIKTDILNSTISGGKIQELQYDLQSRSIIIKIQTTSDGSLMVTIPKFITDLNPSDKPFKDFHTVLVDGMEKKIDLISATNGSRFIIPFTNGTQEIEIIGNQVGQQS